MQKILKIVDDNKIDPAPSVRLDNPSYIFKSKEKNHTNIQWKAKWVNGTLTYPKDKL